MIRIKEITEAQLVSGPVFLKELYLDLGLLAHIYINGRWYMHESVEGWIKICCISAHHILFPAYVPSLISVYYQPPSDNVINDQI